MGARTPSGLASFLDPIPHSGLLCPALIQGEELCFTETGYAMCWSYPWEACPLQNRNRGVDGVGQREVGKGKGERRGDCGWHGKI